MSWLLRLVPPKRHQHIEDDQVSADKAEALVRNIFGSGVLEVSAREEARAVLAATRLRDTA